MNRCVLLSLPAGLIFAAKLGGQTLSCPQVPATKPGECVVTFKQSPMQIVLSVVGADGKPAKSQAIALRSVPAMVTATVITSDDGLAVVQWSGAAPATVKATTTVGAVVLETDITISLPPKKASGLTIVEGRRQFWYAGKQTKDSIVARLDGVDASSCAGNTIVFKPIGDGAATTPDSAMTTWYAACLASTRWKLGSVVGEQHLRASLAGDVSIQDVATAQARALPWLAVGLAYTGVKGYLGVDTMTKDSVTIKGGTVFSPTVGINWPLWYSQPRYRASLSADARDLSNHWFAGISIAQVVYGISHEDIGIDYQLVAHIARRLVVEDAKACVPGRCATKHETKFIGWGVVFQLNQTAVLSTILTALKGG